MDNLNKNQFLLLVLLVTFVTSIATGIMTSSLLSQAPLEVTRTINQVIEKTIDQVTPVTGILSPSQPTQTTTVVVKEEDQVLSAINKNTQSVVRIMDLDTTTQTETLFGIGIILTKDGQIISPRQTITSGNTYTAVLPDGTHIALNPVGVDKNTMFIMFVPLKNDKKVTFIPATFGVNDPQLGQTVMSLGGNASNAVSVGRVVSLILKDTGVASSTSKTITSIETDVSTKDLVSGSPLFNLSGDMIGIQVTPDVSHTFAPTALIKKDLPVLVQAIP